MNQSKELKRFQELSDKILNWPTPQQIPTLLLVTSSDDWRLQCEQALSYVNVQMRSTDNLKDAINILQQEHPHLLIVDRVLTDSTAGGNLLTRSSSSVYLCFSLPDIVDLKPDAQQKWLKAPQNAVKKWVKDYYEAPFKFRDDVSALREQAEMLSTSVPLETMRSRFNTVAQQCKELLDTFPSPATLAVIERILGEPKLNDKEMLMFIGVSLEELIRIDEATRTFIRPILDEVNRLDELLLQERLKRSDFETLRRQCEALLNTSSSETTRTFIEPILDELKRSDGEDIPIASIGNLIKRGVLSELRRNPAILYYSGKTFDEALTDFVHDAKTQFIELLQTPRVDITRGYIADVIKGVIYGASRKDLHRIARRIYGELTKDQWDSYWEEYSLLCLEKDIIPDREGEQFKIYVWGQSLKKASERLNWVEAIEDEITEGVVTDMLPTEFNQQIEQQISEILIDASSRIHPVRFIHQFFQLWPLGRKEQHGEGKKIAEELGITTSAQTLDSTQRIPDKLRELDVKFPNYDWDDFAEHISWYVENLPDKVTIVPEGLQALMQLEPQLGGQILWNIYRWCAKNAREMQYSHSTGINLNVENWVMDVQLYRRTLFEVVVELIYKSDWEE